MRWEKELTVSLIERAQQGDKAALDRLIEDNTPLVKALVKRYLNRGSEFDDLFQIGIIGLIKAINGFNTEFEVRFSTYAVPMINGELKRFVRDNTPVKMPRSLKEMQQKIRYARQKLSLALSGEPTAQDISRETGIPLEDVLYAIESMAFPRSLDEPMFDEAGSTVMDTLEDSRNSFSKLSDKLALRQCLDQLDERERKVILLRYFKNLTQSNIADMMGISQVQISRIESRVLEKLRKKLG